MGCFSVDAMRIAKALCLVVTFCHITACVYCAIGLHEEQLCSQQAVAPVACSWISHNLPDFRVSGHQEIYLR